MRTRACQFLSLLLVVLALAPAMAHLLELPNKIVLSRDDYFVVQQIYRGWALLGFVIFGALLSTFMLAVITRHDYRSFILTLAALSCIAASLLVFFTFTYPANQATDNWTRVPENWFALRRQWEYSHAANAGLYWLAFVLLLLAALRTEPSARC